MTLGRKKGIKPNHIIFRQISVGKGELDDRRIRTTTSEDGRTEKIIWRGRFDQP
ncbi:hypothetical protein HanIR_Chr05g0224101 [Helianthus annuus]|nr:hypothetical protein HanIR_Chr05g0224101 [Helianthus annuus]